MKKHADPKNNPTDEREKLIGLGKRSISKSYYPELKARLDELEHFRTLLDRVSDAILIVDADTGIIIDASGSTQIMIGCPAKDIIGLHFKKILPEHVSRYTENLFCPKNATLSLETEFCCPNDSKSDSVPVEMTLRIVTDQGKRQAVIVARDISERKRNEEALIKSHDQLEIRVRERTRELDRANQAKSEFLSIVSHELRTPLTSIIGFAKINLKKLTTKIFPVVDLTENKKLQKEINRIKKNIEIIISEGDRLTELINDVLDLAKLEADKVEYKMKPTSPNDFITRSIEATAALFENSNLVLQADIEPHLPKILGDFDRLIQVMINLFSNAVKFTDEGNISCKARQVDNHVRISVSDTGIGIPKELQAIIFEKFTQGHKSMADRPKGTGLGLPICRSIVNGHGGHIWLESTQDRGSKFVFTLPVLPSSK
jgi:PAS domain S-box-containing protein